MSNCECVYVCVFYSCVYIFVWVCFIIYIYMVTCNRCVQIRFILYIWCHDVDVREDIYIYIYAGVYYIFVDYKTMAQSLTPKKDSPLDLPLDCLMHWAWRAWRHTRRKRWRGEIDCGTHHTMGVTLSFTSSLNSVFGYLSIYLSI